MQYQRTLTRLTLFGAALLFVFVLPQTSRAQSRDRVGVVQRLQGDVSIVHFGGSARALEGMTVSLEDRLVTGAKARLQIMLTDDTQITLGENAEAVIKQYQFNPFVSGEKGVVLVEVSRGSFLFTTGRISQLADKRIEVKTALADLTAKGTEFWAGPTGEDTEGVAVFEGSVEVSNEGGAVVLSARGLTQSRVQSQTQALGMRPRSSTDPIGTTLTRRQGPSQAVIWPQEKTDRAVDAVRFASEIARNFISNSGNSSAP
jgi:ferric-dicitrate binding protein FerR (iron transport regulator)